MRRNKCGIAAIKCATSTKAAKYYGNITKIVRETISKAVKVQRPVFLLARSIFRSQFANARPPSGTRDKRLLQ